MIGLTVQHFVSTAVGIALAVALVLVRGFCRVRRAEIGNIGVDLTRAIVRVLLSIGFVFAVLTVFVGGLLVIQVSSSPRSPRSPPHAVRAPELTGHAPGTSPDSGTRPPKRSG